MRFHYKVKQAQNFCNQRTFSRNNAVKNKADQDEATIQTGNYDQCFKGR